MKTHRISATQKGMTLVEIMIAMLIGVFLTAGVLQIFISAKQAYKLQENLSRLQENGRIAMDLISKDVRMAGYADYSCLPVTAVNAPPFGAVNALCCSNLAGTDAIRTFRWLGTSSTGCPAKITSTTPPIDCSITPLHISCPANAAEVSYFVKNSSNTGLPALFRRDSAVSASDVERVEGIESMRVLYGVDTDTGCTATPVPVGCYVPNFYVDAATVATNSYWNQVVSIRITLLAITPDNGLTDTPQPYTFNGTTVTPPQVCSSNGVITASALPSTPTTAPTCATGSSLVPDTRMRRVFSTTIAVRNRLP
jgi:type IV pilus assembly protein PilW